MKFVILHITDSNKHFGSAIQEYIKRLGNLVHLESIKPTKHGSVSQIIKQDTDNLIYVLQKKYSSATKVVLNSEGKEMSTQDFCDFCFTQGTIVFIIGGPYGLNYQKFDNFVHKEISFGKITLPHGLVKLVLLEQLYRVNTIRVGKKYHY